MRKKRQYRSKAWAGYFVRYERDGDGHLQIVDRTGGTHRTANMSVHECEGMVRSGLWEYATEDE